MGTLLDVEDVDRASLHAGGFVAGPRPAAAGPGRLPALRRVPGEDRARRAGRRPDARRAAGCRAWTATTCWWRSGKTRSGASRPRRSRVPGWKWSSEHGRQQQSRPADDRGARQGAGHRSPGRHRRHRGRGAHGVAQGLQGRREPEGALQPRDGPRRPGGGADRRRDGREPGDRDLARRSQGDLHRGVRRRGGGQRRTRRRDGVPQADRGLRPHRRADRQAGDLPEGPRGRAREHLRRVQRARRRGASPGW